MQTILFITPPFTQLNTPYPATAYLKGFFNTKNISTHQMDWGIEVILYLFSKKGLSELFIETEECKKSDNASRIYALRKEYIKTIDDVILFLQGKNNTLARQICTIGFLPEASRFSNQNDTEDAFGYMGLIDKAKHLATLYLEDLSDYMIECVDPYFGFSRYAEKLGKSANSFDELHQKLLEKNSFISTISLPILHEKLEQTNPILVCFSVPFPGNLFAAFKGAQYIKEHFPHIKTAMGGGFANTELRSLKDPRVFEFFDFITLDDGELPLELLYHHIINKSEPLELKRTYLLQNNEVVYYNNSNKTDYKQALVGTPDYSDLPIDQYISVIEVTNLMHSLWSDGRWNKLTMAHGCYWGKCTFCDVSLDYIKIYEPILATEIVDRMQNLISQTGENGFHFVDEAAPPSLMKAVALEILKRKLVVTWWTNIRFEKSFNSDLCFLLKLSGCVAVSGGLEVASDRLLNLIKKGVSVEQVALVTKHFTEAGIMVHAYLMYGYPTQTIQETIDSMEMVRQLFQMGVIQSGFWHQFALTSHSPIGIEPEKFGIIPKKNEIFFADNDVEFYDLTGIDHSSFGHGLKTSLYNYMHGIHFDRPLQKWFDFKIPKTTVPPNFIAKCVEKENPTAHSNSKIINTASDYIYNEKNNAYYYQFYTNTQNVEISIDEKWQKILENILENYNLASGKMMDWKELEKTCTINHLEIKEFWSSKSIEILKLSGILLIL